MSIFLQAKNVLLKARAEQVNEVVRAGDAGGIGRAMNYAPILVNIQNAIDVCERLHQETVDAASAVKSVEQSQADRMASVRAAKNKPAE